MKDSMPDQTTNEANSDHPFAAYVKRVKNTPGVYDDLAECDPAFALFLAPYIRADAT